MGGCGSGRRWGKDTTDKYWVLDVRQLHREGALVPGGKTFELNWPHDGATSVSVLIRAKVGRLVLAHQRSIGDNCWQSLEYSIWLDWTPCTYGGRRAWLCCPAKGCGRRVALLYLVGSGVFACRHCCRLAYACQRKNAHDLTVRQANTIRRRLGWKSGILNFSGGKPKGMHWRTFERLKAKHDALIQISLRGITERLALLDRKLSEIQKNLNIDW